MEQFLYLSDLFDFYGALLTPKQQSCLRLHLYDDLSLSEIGEELKISRQAVYDNIHRSVKTMQSYDDKLQLVKRYRKERQVLNEVCAGLKRLQTEHDCQELSPMIEALAPFLGREEDIH